MRITLSIYLTFFIFNIAHSQKNGSSGVDPNIQSGSLQVKGVVTFSQDNKPIEGVNVINKNTTTNVITDADGYYSIEITSPDAILIFSAMGFRTKEIIVGAQSIINVTLETESKVLQEAVVIGYGKTSREMLTGSVSTISSDMIGKDPLPSLTQAIQGKAGGVHVIQRSGTPGGGIIIRIRGTTSIQASADPLYVVDGIPVNSNTNFVGGSDFNFGGATQGINILATINPDDIESIEILKDAASSAIYGARAANGIVLITTKRGKPGTNVINISTYAGVSEMPPERRYDLMNTEQFVSYMQDFYAYAGKTIPESLLRTDVNTDWQDEIFRKGTIQNYKVSSSGGTEKTRYYTSVGYFNQEGIILNSKFERINARLNLDYQHNKKLSFKTNFNITRALNDRIQEENSREGATKNGFITPPNLPVYENGKFAFDLVNKQRENAVAMLKLPVNKAETFRILGNTSLDYAITPALRINVNGGVDMSYIDEIFFMPPVDIRVFASSRGLAVNRSSKDQLWINENTLTYNKQINAHHVNILGGISFQESKFSFIEGRRSNFASNNIPSISVGGTLASANASIQEWSIISYFGRVNYDYKNKYLLSANFRIDGSSRFGANNKYGKFPSVAAAWRISEEPFLQTNNTISNLKLRGTWGITGNQNIPNYASYSLYSGGLSYLGIPAFTPNILGDSKLGWETTKQINLGIDIGFFHERILLLADGYIKNTSDLLINLQVPRTSGYQTYLRNIGEIQNKGFEFELTTKNLTRKFQWNTLLNMTFNRNKVMSLSNGDLYGSIGGTLSIARVGLPLGSFYGWKMDGVNPETGLIDFAKNDGTVGPPSQPEDKRIIGNPNPDFFGGITNNFQFKGIDLSVEGQFSYGNDIFNYNNFSLLSGNSGSNNGSVDWVKRWRKPGDITDVPKITPDNLDNGTVSSRFVEDGSFLRIRNITLGFTLPSVLTKKAQVKSIRIYATIQNAYVFTHYSGYDPEVSSSPGGANSGLVYGFDYGSYPQPRIFTGGINLTF